MRRAEISGWARHAQTLRSGSAARCFVADANVRQVACFDCGAGRREVCSLKIPHIGERMTTFDDREKGFERKFALDQEQEFKASARRNRMLGEWAAGLMGLAEDRVATYAQAVVRSDLEQPGEEDVLRKVFEDLKGSGVQVSEGEVRMKMDEFMAQAREQVRGDQ